MNESLAEMVREDSAETSDRVNINDLDFGDNMSAQENASEEVKEQTPAVETIELTKLNTWFTANHSKLTGINLVKVSSSGVDPEGTLVVKIPDQKTEGKSKLKVFDDANVTQVLNLSASNMRIFNQGYEITYDAYNSIVLKSYGVKLGLIAVFTTVVDGLSIPYHITKLKAKETKLEVVNPPDTIEAKLSENANMENVQLLYKQIVKHTDGLVTKKDVITWLLKRQSEVQDINHLVQLDNVIIKLLS